MPRKTKEEAAKTRARILASALSLFAKRGYERTTFNDIAARLKMTKGAIYWHFESKEALLVSLVDEMLSGFQRMLGRLMPKDGLTFMAVAETMIDCADLIIKDAKGTAFFMLMRTQIRWGADSMEKTRERLLSTSTNGPYHSFIQAIQRDIECGKVRPEVNPSAVASVCVAIWDGLVQTRIDKFLECDMRSTLQNAYAAVWNSIKI